ncbi:site-specific DNA-methyltransferase [Lysobacter pythonis]|uniref:site-specific DNA-methyltransferase (adenine-specific) n=1 Tax=Solilutibacter pythonis TaxID=2483112 RepID=A0A3M2HKJ5_9GAMM|nr:site-specific DNA-methyltransferase [Lysobacter pythonis]RMH87899.1 site-specific DNA-methyltransferase [Lysobacter pythonis]
MPVLNWLGKRAVKKHHETVPFHLLEPLAEYSCPPGDGGETGNLIVQGDNLAVLKALQPHYAGRVKCVYIDPPYNTGHTGWAYNDNVDGPEIRRWLAQVAGQASDVMDRHDRWLCMMYPRLALLRELLRDDGVIFVSIDDHELAHLKLLMDEIFGRHNYVETFSWIKTGCPANLSRKTRKKAEYVLCYQRGGFHGRFRGRPRMSRSDNPLLKNQNRLKTLVFPAGRVSTGIPGRGMMPAGEYGTAVNRVTLLEAAEYQDGVFVSPVRMRGCFVWTQKNLAAELERGTEVRIRTARMIPSYEKRAYAPETPSNLIGAGENVASNESATGELLRLGVDFRYSKPESLIRYLFNMVAGKDDLILDAFAGAGTTAHAVLRQNAVDGGNRRFILVEMGADIARHVTAERVRRVARGHADAGGGMPGLGGGFQFCGLSRAPLFVADGRIHGAARFADLAGFVWFRETGTGFHGRADSALLGVHRGRAIHLLHGDGFRACSLLHGDVLTPTVLKALPPHDGPRVIYAAACRVDAPRLRRDGIVFKPTPHALKPGP